MDARWEVASSPAPCWLVLFGMAGIGERPAFRGPLSFIYFCGCFLAPAPENLSASLPFDSNLKNQLGIEGSDTITSNGSEAMPLATTKSDDAPPSIPIGIATFVVISADPVATPIAGTVLPFTTVVCPDVRQYFT